MFLENDRFCYAGAGRTWAVSLCVILTYIYEHMEAWKKWGTFFNSSPLGQNGRHFADNIFKCIFMDEKFCILIWIPLKFVPKGSID